MARFDRLSAPPHDPRILFRLRGWTHTVILDDIKNDMSIYFLIFNVPLCRID
jgi:hypothetical protein